MNALYGYRTNRSMKNQESWDYAQIYSSSLMVKLFAFFLVWQLMITILGVFFMSDYLKALAKINILSVLPLLIVLIVKTENRLKKQFGN